MRIKAWALSKGLNQRDIESLNLSHVTDLKVWGGQKQKLREMLELEGFYIPKSMYSAAVGMADKV